MLALTYIYDSLLCMDDVNVRVSRAAYDKYALKAVKLTKKEKRRITIKSLMEKGADLITI